MSLDRIGCSALHAAAFDGCLDTIRDVLQIEGVDVDACDASGSTPLFIAARMGHLEAVRLLQGAGALVDKARPNGITPLFSAARKGHLEVVRFLHGAGASVNQERMDGSTALLVAAEKGHLKVVKFLCRARASVNQADADGLTALAVAAYFGHLEVVRFLVHEVGALVDQADVNDAAPLLRAAERGDLEVVRCLVKGGASVNRTDVSGVTGLSLAAYFGYLKVARFFVQETEALVDKVDVYGTTPLWKAAEQGHLKVVKLLAKKAGETVERANFNSCTPLMIAAYKGYLRVVRFLVQGAGADVNKTSDNGTTALYLAAQQGHGAVVGLLLRLGANVGLCFSPNVRKPFDALGHNREVTVLMLAAAYDSAFAAGMCNCAAEAGGVVQSARALQMRWLRAAVARTITSLHVELHCVITTAVEDWKTRTKPLASEDAEKFLRLFIRLPEELQLTLSQILARRVTLSMAEDVKVGLSASACSAQGWIAQVQEGRQVMQQIQFFPLDVRVAVKRWIREGDHPMPTRAQQVRENTLQRHVDRSCEQCCVS